MPSGLYRWQPRYKYYQLNRSETIIMNYEIDTQCKGNNAIDKSINKLIRKFVKN